CRLFAAPVPRAGAFRSVVSLLVLDGVQRARAGNLGGAEQSLAAGWRIAGSLRDRPELISQVIAMGLDRTLLQAMRRVTLGPVAWAAPHDYRASLTSSFAMEAWLPTTYARGAAPGGLSVLQDGTV